MTSSSAKTRHQVLRHRTPLVAHVRKAAHRSGRRSAPTSVRCECERPRTRPLSPCSSRPTHASPRVSSTTAPSVSPVGKSIGPGGRHGTLGKAMQRHSTTETRLPIDICGTRQFTQIDAVERRSGRAYARLLDQKNTAVVLLQAVLRGGCLGPLWLWQRSAAQDAMPWSSGRWPWRSRCFSFLEAGAHATAPDRQ